MPNKIDELLDTVIENDYCIGCGVCASVVESPFTMKLNDNGMYRPVLNENQNKIHSTNIASICPFSDESKNENYLGTESFHKYNAEYNEYTGYYLKNYAGYVKEGAYREQGSSGGMGNWIASKLLEKKLVDGIIHVKETIDYNSDILFEYQISYTPESLEKGAKSKYYPIELSRVIELVRKNEGKYALIGIPCFIKSVRLLAREDQLIMNRIKFYIGLVCGHLKSDMFAKSIGWQLGIKPDNLTHIDFRKKIPDNNANDYGVEVTGVVQDSEQTIDSPTKELFTTNWGLGYFKYNACEFCDDVLAETADITVGDAWLPEYKSDYMGTNIITVRHPKLLEVIEEYRVSGQLYLDELTPERIYESQAGGFRHRRDGLAYRLYLKDKKGQWRPNKRVNADDKLSKNRKLIYKKRMLLSKESFKAFKLAEEENNFVTFKNEMLPLVDEYKNLLKPSFMKRVVNKIKREVRRRISE